MYLIYFNSNSTKVHILVAAQGLSTEISVDGLCTWCSELNFWRSIFVSDSILSTEFLNMSSYFGIWSTFKMLKSLMAGQNNMCFCVSSSRLHFLQRISDNPFLKFDLRSNMLVLVANVNAFSFIESLHIKDLRISLTLVFMETLKFDTY